MKKLKNLLNESVEMGKVYSNPYATAFVKENDEHRHEESSEMTNEQKMAFLEAVKAYKSFGETVYRNEGLAEVYESIKGLVESAGKNMVKETEGSFDGITVGRHVKRMNESFRIFEKTLREVGTLQQRLESTYDEIGEVLGKYYEINESEEPVEEGNEFGAARAKAIANGDSEFEVDGKTYPVKDVDKDDKENAKDFANESTSMKLTDMLNENKYSIIDPRGNAAGTGTKDQANKRAKQLGGNKKGYFVVPAHRAKEARRAMERFKFNFKNAKLQDKMSGLYFDDEMFDESAVNEARVSAKKLLQSVVKGETDRVEGIKMSKEMAQSFLDWQRLSPYGKKYGTLPFNRLFTAAFSWGLNRHADKKSKEYKELEAKANQMFKARRGESVNEGKHDAILDKLADIVKGAKSFMDIGKELKSNGIKYSFGTNMIPMYIIDKPVKIAILNKKYADGAEREVGSTAIGLMESVMNEAKYDIGMARKGNGLTVYNKAEEENGDYKNVAHIDNKGKVKYLDKKIPSNIKKQIEAEAAKMKEAVSESKGSTMKLKKLLNESFGYGELPSSKLMKMKVSAKDMLDSVKNKKVNESEAVEEEKINEGFATWEMRFSDMNLGGVKLSKKNVYKVKARNTVEAIKKAAKMAGIKGNDWVATETHSLKKIG